MSELKEYITQEQENGAIFISQDVIATIAAVAASEVEGVCALAGSQGGEFSDRFSKKSIAKGIRLSQNDNDEICVECSLIAQYGYSVLDLVHTFDRVNGVHIPYVIAPRRPGDIAENYADPSKAKALLGWTAEKTLEDMCRDTYRFQKLNPKGYHG